MNFNPLCRSLIPICLLLSGCASQLQPKSDYKPPAGAAAMENSALDTSYLKPVTGHKGDQLGAEVVSAETIGDELLIEILVPIDPDRVDQVHVTSETGNSVVLTREARILQNYESNNVGISIRIPKSENLGFRLKLVDHPDNNWPPLRHQ